MDFRLLDAGDTALTIEFGETVDRRLLARVAAAEEILAQRVAAGRLAGVVETVPTFRSLTVIYDPLRTSRSALEPLIRSALEQAASAVARQGALWEFPVCYGDQLPEAGPDLADLAEHCGLTPAEVVELHSGVAYEVHLIGFLPGFPFMGDLSTRLARPRRVEPRVRVPAGSVATAGALTGIYPWDSPGGWHLIGRCPVPLFSADWARAALLQPGDRVRFRAVGVGEYHSLITRIGDGQSIDRLEREFRAAGAAGRRR
ncbi:5-oxoprolinase subunit PxpB [Accumulibacter sp.]|uniref:5-oxoprolinase subunit PxpB n=1 Tax=Accumulibacter sp. TaxID=2053492 RepID=UPI0025DED47C|nr:5-oxoprolinase subunit PxpB [Accumulibacter sp.]MCM8626729.1 5-oxoprolinase subunit PxpB [Accumulibacter sp.]